MAIKQDDYEIVDTLPPGSLGDYEVVPEGSLQDIQPQTPTGLPQLVENALNFPVPGGPLGSTVSQVATSPARGFRGLGVGAQAIMENPPSMGNTLNAIERAGAAVQPGFQPEPGEKIGAFVGETIGSLPLGFAAGGFVAPQAHLTYKMLGGALGGTALSAIQGMSENGFIDKNAVGWSAVIGGGVPFLRPAFQGTKNFINFLKESGTAAAGIRPGAVTVAEEIGSKIKDVDGTAQVVQAKIDDMQTTALQVHEAAGEQLNKTRKALDLPATLLEKGERRFGRRIIEESVSANPQQVKGNPGFVEVMVNGNPLILEKRTADKLRGEMVEKYGEEVAGGSPKAVWRQANKLLEDLTTGTQKGMNERAKIKTLDFLREKIGDYTDYARSGLSLAPITEQDAAMFNSLLKEVNGVIQKSGGLGEKLRKSEGLYSQMREFYDNFQSNFSTPDKASRTVLGLLREDKVEEILGTGEVAIEAIKTLEKETGKKFLDPLRKVLASRNMKNIRASSYGAGPARTLGAENLPSTIYGFNQAADLTGVLGELFGSHAARLAAIAGSGARSGGSSGRRTNSY